jgi:RNA polymerase sigma factor (sigma-70 family)
MTDDQRLLQEYVSRQSREALDQLVRRHLDLVYSSARRQVRDEHLAQDVAQSVFLVLAKKAHTIRGGVAVAGWLLAVTRCASLDALRRKARRTKYERAAMKNESQEITAEDWSEMAPLLDEQLNRLGARDRDAVVLRYFQNRSFADVGEELGLTPEAARKRVDRALARLRGLLANRGVRAPAAALGAGIAAYAVAAAPAHAVAAITAPAASTHGIQFARGAMKMMFWTKAKITLATAAAVLFVAGSATIVIPHAFAQQATTGNLTIIGGNTPGTTFTLAVATTQLAGDASTEQSEVSDGPFEFDLTAGDEVNLELPSALRCDFRAPNKADPAIANHVYTVNDARMREVNRLLGADFGLSTNLLLSMGPHGGGTNNLGIQFMLDSHNGDSIAPVDSENWATPDPDFLNSAMSLWMKNNPTPAGLDHIAIEIDLQAVLPLTYVCRSTQGHLFLIQFTKFTKSRTSPTPTVTVDIKRVLEK